jgi:hypothetical protein
MAPSSQGMKFHFGPRVLELFFHFYPIKTDSPQTSRILAFSDRLGGPEPGHARFSFLIKLSAKPRGVCNEDHSYFFLCSLFERYASRG